MPIYEYRCASCSHQQEFLLKVSDAPLTICTKCGKPTFSKMVTAAGFQLKGSGWYVTDFRGGAKPAAKTGDGASKSDAAPSGDSKPAADSKPADSKPADSKPVEPKPADKKASPPSSGAA